MYYNYLTLLRTEFQENIEPIVKRQEMKNNGFVSENA